LLCNRPRLNFGLRFEWTLLVRDGRPLLATVYVVVSMLAGLAASAAGLWLGRRWVPG
jgi:fluoride ion exporter CrcB/FEX